MESTKSQIRSFKPFAGALLFSMAVHNDVSLFSWANSHPRWPGCCCLHAAADLPGGEDAQWVLDYANSPSYSVSNAGVPGPGVDSRIDLWTSWEQYTERAERLLYSLAAGNIHAIDGSLTWITVETETDEGEYLQLLVAEKARQLENFYKASLDQLEGLARRGSQFATQILQSRLEVAKNPEEEARFVFWSFINCSVYNGEMGSFFTYRALAETKIGVFQLGKCFEEAKEYNQWIDSAYACTQMCFDDGIMSNPQISSVQAKIEYYIHQYKHAEEIARRAIDLWSIGMMKQGLIYDVRHMIVKLLWDARWTWVQEWVSEGKMKRLKRFYAEAGTGHAPLPGVN